MENLGQHHFESLLKTGDARFERQVDALVVDGTGNPVSATVSVKTADHNQLHIRHFFI
jgi:hypothetical protein